jgi:peptidoglycan/xylan/chitin deacetylase (PgdA/CDA1 family)
VALTYDDGPGVSTRALLDVLARHDARATFFMVGSEVLSSPELARAVVAAGHDVGSHSMNHVDHATADPDAAIAAMVAGAEAIAQVLGFEPCLYRAPYGNFTSETVAEAARRGWTCVHWSALGDDWKEHATATSVAELVKTTLEPGAIVLLHDSRRAKPTSPEPVVGGTGLLLAELERRKLRSVRLGDMLL